MYNDHIDPKGFRANVGIILSNTQDRLLLGGRLGNKGWQFPQGGMLKGETPEQAMFRELEEEVGLTGDDVVLLGATERWVRYRLPDRFVRRDSKPLCIGQKQRWFLLRLEVPDNRVRLDRSDCPEFDRWRWVEFWQPVNEVIYFKRRVYAQVLHELGPFLFPQGLPPRPRSWSKRWRMTFDKDIKRAAELRQNSKRLDDSQTNNC